MPDNSNGFNFDDDPDDEQGAMAAARLLCNDSVGVAMLSAPAESNFGLAEEAEKHLPKYTKQMRRTAKWLKNVSRLANDGGGW